MLNKDRYTLFPFIPLLVGAWTAVLAAMPSCTFAPTQVIYGSGANSGMLGRDPQTGGELVSPFVKDRYNALVAIYGTKFAPALKPDVGFSVYTTNTPAGTNAPVIYTLDPSHLHDYLEMSVWRRNGK